MLAVADGHGGVRYVRSHLGARLAVRVAVGLMRDFAVCWSGAVSLSLAKRTAEEWLPRTLVERWQAAVGRHLHGAPLTAEELAVMTAAGPDTHRPAQVRPLTAYGSTVLVVLIADAFSVALQLGDGDILTVAETGAVRRVVPADDRLFANQTTSLCGEDAWRDVRVGFYPLAGGRPALLLLATDGYANSFRDDGGFLQVGADMLALLREDGAEPVRRGLPAWLADTSRRGSGDDITLGLVYRPDALNRVDVTPRLFAPASADYPSAALPDQRSFVWAQDSEEVVLGNSGAPIRPDAPAFLRPGG